MTQSLARTVIIPPAGTPAACGPCGPYLGAWWPEGQTLSSLDYYADATAWLAGDTLTQVGVSAAPSGTGELSVNSVTVSGSIIGPIEMSGGVPGRIYTVAIEIDTAAGRQDLWVIGLLINPILQSFPPVVAPSPEFGTQVVWPSSPPTVNYGLFFNNPLAWSAWPFGAGPTPT